MKDEIKKTATQLLYEKGVDFLRLKGAYADTDRNYRMVYGDQWEGLPKGPTDPISYNILEPIVDYKVGTLNSNLWAINYSSENFDNNEFKETADKACTNLNRHAAKIWEKDDMDYKIYSLSEDACINDEGIIYANFDTKTKEPTNEILNKVDVCYGNENNPEIQTQPYIIIKSRKPVSEIQQLARENGVSEEEILNIVGDQTTSEEAGNDAKYEVNDMCNLLTKLWKENGTVHYSKSTSTVDIIEDEDSGLTLYPLEHFVWKNVKGSARGIGEVKYTIPNQLEINKTATRRAITVQQIAYPQKAINIDKIANPEDINKVGSTLKVRGQDVDDVRKVVNITTPGQMGSDAEKLQAEMITNTRELKNAGDSATGQIDPEQASGRAILAVQRASQQPLNKQRITLKRCIANLAKIWFEMWKVYSTDGKEVLEEVEQTNSMTGEVEMIEKPYKIPQSVLDTLKTTVKIDVTPTGAFDKFAKEMSWENLFTNKLINLEEYEDGLDDDSVMPKQKIKRIVEKRKKEQQKIAEIQKQAALLQSTFDNGINQIDEEVSANAPVEQMQPAQ